jgi:hypothetical protein
MVDVIIRPFEAKDRAQVRDLCRRTHRMSAILEDDEVIPMLFADYYLDCEPELCFVAEVDGRVIGYAMGATSAKRTRWLMQRIPRLFLRVVWKLISFQFRRPVTYELLWYFLTKSWRERPRPTLPLDQYPVHFHFQVDADYRHLHPGPALITTFLNHLKAIGVKGVRGAIVEEAGDERLSKYLCRKFDGRILASTEASLLNRFSDKKWVLRVLVKDLCR